MKTIAINTLSLHSIKAGMGNYVYHLVHELTSLDTLNKYIIYVSQKNRSLFSSLRKKKNIILIVVSPLFSTPKTKIFWEQCLLPFSLMKRGIDVYHSPGFTQSFFSVIFGTFRRIFFGKKLKTVMTIADMTFHTHPRCHRFLKVLYFRFMIPISAKISDVVFTISDSTRKDVLDLISLPPQKVITTHLAAAKEFTVLKDKKIIEKVLKKYGIPNKYVLFVSVLEPRKNIVGLLKAFHKLLMEGSFSKHTLVIVGKKGWKYDLVFKTIEKLGLKGNVIFTGFVPDEDLVALYNAAEVLAYPSFYEGFGIPIIEAMQCGCPVMTSDLASMKEVASMVEDAACFVDPYTPSSIASGLQKILGDDSYRNKLSSQGLKNAKYFSWKKMAEETLRGYLQ
jgi:glycosyltransferase involved in cell wall biosynthesis